METKEIAMSKSKKTMGAACVLAMAAFAAGPAAASTLTDFSGVVSTEFANDKFGQNGGGSSDTDKSWLLGGSAAGPLSTLPNMNFQVDASYRTLWDSHFSAIDWNFGGSLFWANDDGRVGVNFNYETVTREGHLTNGGVFGEWYFGNLTAMGKGGWLSSGGTETGGRGNYFGVGVEGYIMPDLGITGGVNWTDVITGVGCQVCGRRDVRATLYGIMGEFLFSEDYGISGYAGYTYVQNKIFQEDSHDNIWRIGLRWYTGGGSLESHQRNGNLNPWLPAAGRS
jgi:hypothetical protein